MGLFSAFRKTAVITRKQDEQLYSMVAKELAEHIRYDGLWVKALALADGNKEKQLAEYVKLRVQALKDEIYIASEANANKEETGKKSEKTSIKKRAKLGLRFDMHTGEILLISPGYASFSSGLTYGDKIIEVNGISFADNLTAVRTCLESPDIDVFVFVVIRHGNILTFSVNA